MNNQLYTKLKLDSFAYSRKRKNSTKTLLVSVVSIILALIVALLVATAMGYDPFIILGRLFSIGFEDPSYLIYKIGIFTLAGFAFYFAWKCGIINIGISGQMLLSGTIIVLVTRALGDKIPNGAGQIFIIFLGMLVGCMLSTFVGILQTYLKVNAVVSAILLNWIVYFISFYVLATYTVPKENNFVSSGEIPLNYCLVDQNTNTGGIIPIIIIICILTIIMVVVFKYTVFGHKIKSIGLSKEASQYAGYNTNVLSLSSYAISGAISGILACVCYTSSTLNAIPLSTYFDSIPTQGFDGIMIALVGNNNPIGIVLVSILFGLFGASSQGLPTDPSFNNVIIGCVLLGSAMSVLLYKVKPWVKIKSFKYDKNFDETQTIFDNSIDSLLSKYYSIYAVDKTTLKEIKKNQDLKKLNELATEYHITLNTSDDFIRQFNIYKQARIKMLYDKYLNEKARIIDQFHYHEILNLINARLLTKEIIEQKKTIIEHKYDFRLTKYLNKLKQRQLRLEDKNKKANYALNDKLAQLINNNNNKRQQAIRNNNQWKQNAINRMTNFQNRYLVNQAKINDQVNKINLAMSKINNQDHKDHINQLLITVNSYQKEVKK